MILILLSVHPEYGGSDYDAFQTRLRSNTCSLLLWFYWSPTLLYIQGRGSYLFSKFSFSEVMDYYVCVFSLSLQLSYFGTYWEPVFQSTWLHAQTKNKHYVESIMSFYWEAFPFVRQSAGWVLVYNNNCCKLVPWTIRRLRVCKFWIKDLLSLTWGPSYNHHHGVKYLDDRVLGKLEETTYTKRKTLDLREILVVEECHTTGILNLSKQIIVASKKLH